MNIGFAHAPLVGPGEGRLLNRLTAVRQRKEALLCTSDGDINPSMSMAQAGVRSAMAAPKLAMTALIDAPRFRSGRNSTASRAIASRPVNAIARTPATPLTGNSGPSVKPIRAASSIEITD